MIDKSMVFLSFGAGVQSSVMLMLAIRGEIERPDHVIWADTGFEPCAVYRHVDWAQRQCEKAGMPFHRVKAKRNLREEFHDFESGKAKHWNARPPLYIDASSTRFLSFPSQLRRQCTKHVKILPLQREELRLMGFKSQRGVPDGACIVQIGISTDEVRRAAPSQYAWYELDYPLIDPLKMSRGDCQSWWERNFPHVSLPSSSCTICPYKTDDMWRRMAESSPEDFAEAVEYDERIRQAYRTKTDQIFYLSPLLKPVADVGKETGQESFDLEDEIYCAGGCGL